MTEDMVMVIAVMFFCGFWAVFYALQVRSLQRDLAKAEQRIETLQLAVKSLAQQHEADNITITFYQRRLAYHIATALAHGLALAHLN